VRNVESIIVVLGPRCGGTSAVAGVLHHLGVYMGAGFFWAFREPHETWEDVRLSELCRVAFGDPGDRLQVEPDFFRERLRDWAVEHRRGASNSGSPSGVKYPLLCLAVDLVRDACGPVTWVVVDRPFDKVVTSLNRLGWLRDEDERRESTTHLIAERDRALGSDHTVHVDFEALRGEPETTIRGLAEDLGLEVTEDRVKAAVESIMQPTDARRAVRSADLYQDTIDLLLPRVERNPRDVQSAWILALAYFYQRDFANAGKWYARAAELSGSHEMVYFSLYRVAESMANLGEPWPEVKETYLRAWESRPTRAEPLYAIARRYRVDRRYRLGYLYARHAAAIPFPEQDTIFDSIDILTWRAVDEQAVCASWIGKKPEALELWQRLLARTDIPAEDRQRIAENCDICAPAAAGGG
jgi:tetratricopeptide (TPR) repeat protein